MVFKALVFAIGLATASQTAFANTPAWTPEDGDLIAFDVFRKGEKFGTHTVSFDVQGDKLIADTDVRLRVGLGPVTFFSYRLDATETWQNGQLISVEGRLKEGGDREKVDAARNGSAIKVDGSAFRGDAPAEILPSSHWRKDIVNSDVILSTENGQLLEIDARPVSTDTLTINGQSVTATRYDVTAALPYSIWYDEQGRWVKLSFTARGDLIEYRLSQFY